MRMCHVLSSGKEQRAVSPGSLEQMWEQSGRKAASLLQTTSEAHPEVLGILWVLWGVRGVLEEHSPGFLREASDAFSCRYELSDGRWNELGKRSSSERHGLIGGQGSRERRGGETYLGTAVRQRRSSADLRVRHVESHRRECVITFPSGFEIACSSGQISYVYHMERIAFCVMSM